MSTKTIIEIALILLYLFFILRRNKRRDLVIFIFIAVVALIAVLGNKFNYNGDFVAITLAVLFTVGVFLYDKKYNKENRNGSEN